MTTNYQMDRVFAALSHSARGEMLDHLSNQPGVTLGQSAQKFDVSRIAVMNHLKVLEDAQLVNREKEGRTGRLHLHAVPLQTIYERWTDRFSAHWLDRMSHSGGRSRSETQNGMILTASATTNIKRILINAKKIFWNTLVKTDEALPFFFGAVSETKDGMRVGANYRMVSANRRLRRSLARRFDLSRQMYIPTRSK